MASDTPASTTKTETQVVDLTQADEARYVEIHTEAGIVAPGGHWDADAKTDDLAVRVQLEKRPGGKTPE